MSLPFDVRKLVTSFAKDNQDVTSLKFINKDPNGVNIESLSGGLMNYCFRVSSRDGKHSVVLKHAEEISKGIEMEKISVQRQHVEYDCLEFLHSLIPGNVPEPYCLDNTHNIIAMQDLSDWQLWGDQMQNEGPDLVVVSELGRATAKMHRETNKANVSREKWVELGRFRQPDIKAIACDFMCHRYYEDQDKLNRLDDSVREAYIKYQQDSIGPHLQKTFEKLFAEETCLIQIDSHWKSVFVKNGHIVMFDFEIITLGNPCVSIGYYVTCFLVCFLVYVKNHQPDKGGDDMKTQFQNGVVCMLKTYVEEAGVAEDADCSFISQVAFFSGAMAGLLSLFDSVQDLDAAVTPDIQIALMHQGFRLMKAHTSIRTVEQLAEALFKD